MHFIFLITVDIHSVILISGMQHSVWAFIYLAK